MGVWSIESVTISCKTNKPTATGSYPQVFALTTVLIRLGLTSGNLKLPLSMRLVLLLPVESCRKKDKLVEFKLNSTQVSEPTSVRTVRLVHT